MRSRSFCGAGSPRSKSRVGSSSGTTCPARTRARSSSASSAPPTGRRPAARSSRGWDRVAQGALMVRPLSDEDLAILGLESDAVAGHTCKVLVLEDEIDADQLRGAMAARLEHAPELSMRLTEVDGAMCWERTDVDLAEHVIADPSRGPVDDEGLLALVARAFERRLDRAKPLWRIDVVGP